jgi:hypothetical protein
MEEKTVYLSCVLFLTVSQSQKVSPELRGFTQLALNDPEIIGNIIKALLEVFFENFNKSSLLTNNNYRSQLSF